MMEVMRKVMVLQGAWLTSVVNTLHAKLSRRLKFSELGGQDILKPAIFHVVIQGLSVLGLTGGVSGGPILLPNIFPPSCNTEHQRFELFADFRFLMDLWESLFIKFCSILTKVVFIYNTPVHKFLVSKIKYPLTP